MQFKLVGVKGEKKRFPKLTLASKYPLQTDVSNNQEKKSN